VKSSGRTPLNLADPVAMAVVRARLTGIPLVVSSVMSLLARQGQPADEVNRAGLLPLVAVVSMGLLGVAVLLTRGRLGDRGFLGSLVLFQLLLLCLGWSVQRAGGQMPTAILLIGPTTTAAVFCSKKWHVGVQVLTATAVAGALAFQQHPTLAAATGEAGGHVFSYAVLAFTVHWLRERAVQSLVAAQRGEITDPLTGLTNRRGLEQLAGQTWRQTALARRPVAVIVVDIDHFKRVNDTLGHAAGDALLCSVARSLETGVRERDIVTRLGGEEFVVVAEIEPADAVVLAERLRARVERDVHPITVSVGVLELVPDPGADEDVTPAIWHAVNEADEALFEAKSSGRNRVVSAVHGGPPPHG
jgi:diguanylate cyclase (GGDEF)-like protein